MELLPIESLEGLNTEGEPQPSRRPTSLNWTLDSLLSIATNFAPVARVSASLPREKLADIISHHEHKGIPLIVEGWHLKEGWDSELLSPDWLARKLTKRQESLFSYSMSFTDGINYSAECMGCLRAGG